MAYRGDLIQSKRNDEMRKWCAIWEIFETDRHTYILAYRGDVCNQTESSRVHWIPGRLQSNNPGPKSRNKKDMSF